MSGATYDSQPEYVDLVYDEVALEQYQPYLVTRHLDVKPTVAYAWVADSTERETRMYCYWVYWTVQHGLSPFDSHQHDREPILVEVDPETDEIEGVVVDGYHYLAKQYPTVPTEDGTHPLLRPTHKWHFYTTTTEVGEFVPLESMHTKYTAWMDNGWLADPKTVTVPWRIKERRHWWDEGRDSVSMNRLFYSSLLNASQITGLNIGGAQATDF
ncbi:hypothetical protein [Natrinema salifodinae]|uniref:hypothetical protein n=1 Tax=Natrinema salifodinae TaxID=1202768 RepID=UPI00067865E6|nr:hypothetical protein [Natrinema salifodinae]